MTVSQAYIGLTTPIGYDYETESEFGYPNPIIEGPMGLFLLYDEIWFLHPDLCPQNMHDLEYVNFMSESFDISDYMARVSNYNPTNNRIQNTQSFIDMGTQGDIVKTIAPTDRWDNHGRSIPGGYMPMTRAKDNYLLDSLISNENDLELITNTVGNEWLSTETEAIQASQQLDITHELITKDMPNCWFKEGPYFEGIDDLRSDKRIKDFRRKIEDETKTAEPTEAIEAIENEFEEYLYKSGDYRTRPKRIYRATIEFVTNFIPGVSTAAGSISSLEELYSAISDYNQFGWAGFLAKARYDGINDRDTNNNNV